ncbi:MAG: TonB-dependent receptor, partial [Lewinella sp.]|nr:TonB-dependent receptor [Lewinella sp.]
MKMRILLSWLAMSLATLTTAQTITGRIKDLETDQALPFATITINQHTTTSLEDGAFSLPLTPATDYELTVRYLGYATHTETFSAAAVAEPLSIQLQPQPIVFAEILIQDRPLGMAPQQQVLTDPSRWVSQPRDAGELFRSVPGFALLKRGGFALEPVFRGFQKDQLNIITDGGLQMTNACPARMDPATTHLSPESIERVEIISGPYSVRYGLTEGPIINLITANPIGEKGLSGEANVGYESNGGSYFSSLQVRAGGERAGLLVNGSLRDYGDYSAGNGQVIPSSFRSYHYSAKGFWQPAREHQFQLSWQQAFERDVDHAGLMMDTDTDDSYAWTLDYHWRAQRTHFQGLKAKVYGFAVDHLMTNVNRPNFAATEARTPVEGQTFGSRLEGQWNLGSRWVTYLGADWRYLARSGDRTRVVKVNMMTGEPLPQPMTFVDKVWQGASLHDLGLFAEARYFPTANLNVATGWRIDQGFWQLADPDPGFLTLYDGVDSRTFDPLLTGHLTTTWRSPRQWVWQLALARGGRLPAMDELGIYHFGIGRDPYEYVGNPNLAPEINYQAELSLQQAVGKVHWRFSTFAGRWHNFITAAVDPNLPRKYMPMAEPRFARRFTNVEAWQWGGELSAEWQLTSYWQFS